MSVYYVSAYTDTEPPYPEQFADDDRDDWTVGYDEGEADARHEIHRLRRVVAAARRVQRHLDTAEPPPWGICSECDSGFGVLRAALADCDG
jgi:hypothetical protein